MHLTGEEIAVIGVVPLIISAVASYTSAKRGKVAVSQSAEALKYVTPNGSGHPTIAAMLEDVLKWQGGHDARHEELDRMVKRIADRISNVEHA